MRCVKADYRRETDRSGNPLTMALWAGCRNKEADEKTSQMVYFSTEIALVRYLRVTAVQDSASLSTPVPRRSVAQTQRPYREYINRHRL
jgi:hypothetical protein